MHEILIAIVLGIVEGLTEFLPVSSTGHLILAGELLGYTGEKAKSFEIFIQLGAILAVAVLYRRRLWAMALDLLPGRRKTGGLTVWHIAAAMAPAVVAGLLLYRPIKETLFAPWAVLVGLAAGGVYLLAAERFAPKPTALDLDGISYRQALGIGLFQCLALWPGFSRSGATIAGGLFTGAALKASADFSFLLAIPMMAAATGLDLLKTWRSLTSGDAAVFAVGFAVSFAVAWLAVAAFLKVLERVRLTPFALYRFAAAALFAGYFWLAR